LGQALSRVVAESADDHFTWPVYEIENFLLDPKIIRGAAQALLRHCPYDTEEDIIGRLRSLAEDIVEELASHEVQYILNNELISSINIGAPKRSPLPSLMRSAHASKERVSKVDISEERIENLLEYSRNRLCADLQSNEFLNRFPGDRLLRALAGDLQISGDHFRNACLDQAQRLKLRPEGMEQTLKNALS
jgi:hypothetical protein